MSLPGGVSGDGPSKWGGGGVCGGECLVNAFLVAAIVHTVDGTTECLYIDTTVSIFHRISCALFVEYVRTVVHLERFDSRAVKMG